jgi:hypothetical protein
MPHANNWNYLERSGALTSAIAALIRNRSEHSIEYIFDGATHRLPPWMGGGWRVACRVIPEQV